MNTYSDQRTDVSVFGAGFTNDNTHCRLCNLSGDHVTGDLDTIASGSHSGCDGIASGGRVCGVWDVDLDGGIASGVRTFDGSCISNACIVGCVASSGRGGCTMLLPSAAAVAAMAAFVVFATLTSIVESPVAFAPLMVATSMTRAPPEMLPSLSTSVHSS